MERFEVNENVVVKFEDGGTSSGKVMRVLEDDIYLVVYCVKGMSSSGLGKFHASQLTSFGTALFLATEYYGAEETELSEVSD